MDERSFPSMEAFAAFLCEYANAPLGQPGTCFSSPLALFLSASFGHVCGVDEGRYGRAIEAFCCWRSLPQWARLFAAWCERYAGLAGSMRVMTGAEAFVVLAWVEAALSGGRSCA
jgi:hypothetical protein